MTSFGKLPMPKEYYIFTKHALDRMDQQGLSKNNALSYMRSGYHVEGGKYDKEKKIFSIRYNEWIFTMQEIEYTKDKGTLLRVITVTNQNYAPKTYGRMRSILGSLKMEK
jgi:hypothetical protein